METLSQLCVSHFVKLKLGNTVLFIHYVSIDIQN
jgi:hypothetical protein